jgi:hypothetical protein
VQFGRTERRFLRSGCRCGVAELEVVRKKRD